VGPAGLVGSPGIMVAPPRATRTSCGSTSAVMTPVAAPARSNADIDEPVRLLHTALDARINLVDTADIYAGGASEEIASSHWPTGVTTSSWRAALHRPRG